MQNVSFIDYSNYKHYFFVVFRDANVPYDLQYFEMKLLFLITALTPDVRTKVRDDYHGLTYLVEFLDLIIKEQSNTTENKESNYLSDNQINLLNEIMRVLFNITVRNETSVATEEEEEIQFRRLAVVLHDLLLCCADAKDKQLELYSNTINLLTNVPTACYSELTTPIHVVGDPAGSSSTASINSAHIFEGHDVTTLNILLDYLQCRLENTQVKMKFVQFLLNFFEKTIKIFFRDHQSNKSSCHQYLLC